MAKQTLKMVIQLRRATTAEWEEYGHLKPAEGEPCFDIELNTLKIGDGVRSYAELPVIGGGSAVSVAADEKSIILKNETFQLVGFDAAEVGAAPRIGQDGKLEWYMPVDTTDLSDLEARVKALEDVNVDAKIDAKINEFATKLTDGDTIDTFKELVDYVAEHGPEAANMAADIAALEKLVGEYSVAEQISSAIEKSGHMTQAEAEEAFLSKADAENLLSKEEAEAFIAKSEAKVIFERVQYEVSHKPDGTLVNYKDGEIRVMCPADTQFELQESGEGANASLYYIGFKAYAPEGAMSFKEDLAEIIADDTMYYFENNDFAGTDAYGRKYSIVWLPVAQYDEAADSWTYYGASSSVEKYIGWYYTVNWYNENGVMIGADQVRINLSNEDCHNTAKPYYVSAAVTTTDIIIMDGGGAAGN